MSASPSESAYRYILATLYIILFLIHALFAVRFLLLLKGSGYALKTWHCLLSISSFFRVLQFTLFAMATFQQEATAGFLITFSASVFYFTAYICLVFYSAEGHIVGPTNFQEKQRRLRLVFHFLMLFFYVLCICFMIVVVVLDLSKATRFKTSVMGTALGCIACMVGFLFLTIMLGVQKSPVGASVHATKSKRKAYVLAVICVVSFFLRSLYLLLAVLYPDEMQDPDHPEVEFVYYLLSEILPTFGVLAVCAGKLSNAKLRKMTKRAGHLAISKRTLFRCVEEGVSHNGESAHSGGSAPSEPASNSCQVVSVASDSDTNHEQDVLLENSIDHYGTL